MERTWIFLLLAIFTIIAILVVFCFKKNKEGKSCGCKLQCDCKKENVPSSKKPIVKEQFTSGEKYEMENPLYVSSNPKSPYFVPYTQPPGDKKAQQYAGTGQGTSGGFLPLQGNGAQLMMLNSNNKNNSVSSHKLGKVGGYPNYTDHDFTSWSYGINDFGANGKISNSYLIDGANNRVANNSQKGGSCDDFWPQAEKDSKGFCVTGNDLIAHCNISRGKDLLKCENGIKFLQHKMKPQWEKVMDKIKQN